MKHRGGSQLAYNFHSMIISPELIWAKACNPWPSSAGSVLSCPMGQLCISSSDYRVLGPSTEPPSPAMRNSYIYRPWKQMLLVAAFPLERAQQGGPAAQGQSASKDSAHRRSPEMARGRFCTFAFGWVQLGLCISGAGVPGSVDRMALSIPHASMVTPCDPDSMALHVLPCTDIPSCSEHGISCVGKPSGSICPS